MASRPTPWSRLAVALTSFAIALSAATGLGLWWASDAQVARVTVLGAGKGLSVLVTDGPARLLIATGDDPVKFKNALSRARPPTARRLDVLLLAPDGGAVGIAGDALAATHARHAATIGAFPSSGSVAAGVARVPPLPAPQRIRLSPQVSVTVETAEIAPAPGKTQADTAWRAVIRRNGTTVVVLRQGSDAARFPTIPNVTAVILAQGDPKPAIVSLAPAALVVSSKVGEGTALRQEIGPLLAHDLWALRVEPGSATPIEFVAGGLRLPADAPQRLRATPAGGIASFPAPPQPVISRRP